MQSKKPRGFEKCRVICRRRSGSLPKLIGYQMHQLMPGFAPITCLAPNVTDANPGFASEMLTIVNNNAFNSLKVQVCLYPRHGVCSNSPENVSPYLQCEQGGATRGYAFIPPASSATIVVRLASNTSGTFAHALRFGYRCAEPCRTPGCLSHELNPASAHSLSRCGRFALDA